MIVLHHVGDDVNVGEEFAELMLEEHLDDVADSSREDDKGHAQMMKGTDQTISTVPEMSKGIEMKKINKVAAYALTLGCPFYLKST